MVRECGHTSISHHIHSYHVTLTLLHQDLGSASPPHESEWACDYSVSDAHLTEALVSGFPSHIVWVPFKLLIFTLFLRWASPYLGPSAITLLIGFCVRDWVHMDTTSLCFLLISMLSFYM